MHDYAWPGEIWHQWTEDRFKEHCGDWKYISHASGASTAKSYDSAKLVGLFWLSDPRNNAAIIASTTLASMESRVWGYLISLLNRVAIPIPYNYVSSPPPKVLNERLHKKDKDTIHGIFAVAAKKGDTQDTINTWIGRHPNKKLMLILDEGPDMPAAINEAFSNLEGNLPWFQCHILGNSVSKFDLHGAMSTPKNGWGSINLDVARRWETTKNKGLCMYYAPEDSPAIHETDPVKKKLLSKFLITQETLDSKKKELGEKSDQYWRMVKGLWRSENAEQTVITESYASNFQVDSKAEWSGLHPLAMFAGLDPAFSLGGDSCMLRLAILGVTTTGLWALDFRGESLMFKIDLDSTDPASIEIQIARKVIKILANYGIPLNRLAVDSNGQGRALSSVLQLEARSNQSPIKIYATRTGNKAVNSFDVTIKTTLEMWHAFRPFIEKGQINGLDYITLRQLTSRLADTDPKTGRQRLETKMQYKSRMSTIDPSLAHSPDEADSAALCLQAAMIAGGFSIGMKSEQRTPQIHDSKMWAYMQEISKMKAETQMSPTRKPPSATFSGTMASAVKHRKAF